MRVPHVHSTRPTDIVPSSCLAEIVFLGSASSFSDNLMQATRMHLPGTELVRLGAVAELADLSADAMRWIRLLLLDEMTLVNAPPALLHRLSRSRSMNVALAFSDHDLAAQRYAAPVGLRIHSFIPLNVRLDVWLSIIKLVLHGGKYVPEELLARRHSPPADGPAPAPAQSDAHDPALPMLGLTDRQYAVLELVAAGLPNKVIAARLGVSEHTVKLHIHNVISRLGVTNRTEAAARFYDGVS